MAVSLTAWIIATGVKSVLKLTTNAKNEITDMFTGNISFTEIYLP